MTEYMIKKQNHVLMLIRERNLFEYYDAYDVAPVEVQNYHNKYMARRRRQRMKYFPNSGNSEVMMLNRTRRARSFGLYHDGLYNSPVNRGTKS